ncbi:hypothetical protein Tco_1190382 [Tanacetum coccineum]
MSTHTKTYDAPCHIKNVFGNIKRVGKDFFGRVTPLFPTTLVQAQEEVGEGSANAIDPDHIPTDSQPSTSQPHEEVVNTAEKEVSTADPVTTIGEVVTTAAPSINTADIKVSTVFVITSIPTTSMIVTTVKDVVSPTIATTTTTTTTIDTRPKAKGLLFKSQLEAKEQEAARLEREEAERQEQANIDLINSSNNVQAMIEADQLLVDKLLEKRRKFFAAKRVEAKRNKPPTQAQQRKLYSNYLKNMERYTLKQLKGFKFRVIKNMSDKGFTRVNTFVDMNIDLVKASEDKAKGSGKKTKDSRKKSIGKKRDAGKHDSESAKNAKIAQEKRVENEQEQRSSKRQRMEDDKETKELKSALSLVLLMRK